MTIKQAIFTVESVAHLQGKERELLPIVGSARAEHEEIIKTMQAVIDALAAYDPDTNKGERRVNATIETMRLLIGKHSA